MVDEVATVNYSREHVDTVGQDETHTTEETSQHKRRGEEDEGENEHSPIVPVWRMLVPSSSDSYYRYHKEYNYLEEVASIALHYHQNQHYYTSKSFSFASTLYFFNSFPSACIYHRA